MDKEISCFLGFGSILMLSTISLMKFLVFFAVEETSTFQGPLLELETLTFLFLSIWSNMLTKTLIRWCLVHEKNQLNASDVYSRINFVRCYDSVG